MSHSQGQSAGKIDIIVCQSDEIIGGWVCHEGSGSGEEKDGPCRAVPVTFWQMMTNDVERSSGLRWACDRWSQQDGRHAPDIIPH